MIINIFQKISIHEIVTRFVCPKCCPKGIPEGLPEGMPEGHHMGHTVPQTTLLFLIECVSHLQRSGLSGFSLGCPSGFALMTSLGKS